MTEEGRTVFAAASRQPLRGIQREFGVHLMPDDLPVVRGFLARLADAGANGGRGGSDSGDADGSAVGAAPPD